MSPVRVKICGLTREEDALEAARLGADALGFNFWPGSKRYCDPATAAKIIRQLPMFVLPVGVFVNQSLSEVRRACRLSGVRVAQLHGDESAQFCERLGVPVMKAVRVEGRESLRAMKRYDVAAFLFDTPSAGFGGSGQTFDWRAVRRRPTDHEVLLAGGLTPDNVREAIRAARPTGVDVASGVETAPGKKDLNKMARFIRAAKEAR